MQVSMNYLKMTLVGAGSRVGSKPRAGGVGPSRRLIAGLLQCTRGIVTVEMKRRANSELEDFFAFQTR